MTKNKTPRRYAWIYTLALPLLGALTFGFAAQAEVPLLGKTTVEPHITAQSPAGAQYTPSAYPLDKNKVTQTVHMVKINESTSAADRDKLNGAEDGAAMRLLIVESNIPADISLMLHTSPGNVYATADGTVVEASHNTDNLNYILIRHGNEYTTKYSRLGTFRVKAGDTVSKGQVIGEIRNSPYLSYEITKNGNHVDPADYLPD